MELLAKSNFSFLRGASSPEALVQRAAELGHKSLALVDHMGFYGSARAHAEARKVGIKAITGATLESIAGFQNLTILNKSRTGYQNLSRLITSLHCEKDVNNFNDHALTGNHAILTPESLLKPTKANLLSAAKNLHHHFGPGNVSIAPFHHFRRGEDKLNRLLRDLGEFLKIPLIASNAPIYSHRSDRLLADAFTCLREHKTLDDAGRFLECNGERFLKSPKEVYNLSVGYPQDFHKAQALSEECSDFSLENLGYRFPSYRDPDTGELFTDREQCEYLRHVVKKGLEKRFRFLSENHRQQIDKELETIEKLKFSGYFLIVWDLVRFARSQGILCQGRGSAANSLVCYAIGVTSVDPVESGLLFERFLSENRQSWPDIDIDFPSGDRREAVIQYVYQKYAPRGAAMTANVITYKPRSAFREMSKILGFPESIANRFTDLCASPKVHDASRDSPSEELSMSNYYPNDKVAELAGTIERSGIPPSHPRFEALLKLYHSILHCPRHLGQHSGGMVFCDDGLDHVVPLQPAAMENRTVLQWDKDDCEDLGIVKVDLLGLGMLAAMEDALKICERRGRPVNLAKIPKDDPATYDLLCRADTVGTFQVESRAQMATLPIMQPRRFYDIAVQVAIIRPGPIVGDLVHPYLNRRTRREDIEYIHPDFEPILKRTLGVPLFQEQVLRMAMLIAGFTGVEADFLRKAMSFKRSDERMNAIVQKLKTRMNERRVSPEVQQRVINSIGSFALYGFPESHAISFALIAYASCWLKVHRPVEFYCGLINNQPMGFYSVNTLMQDAKRHGVRTKPISVIHSIVTTEVIDDHLLRLGFHRLKGLRQKTSERIVEERSKSAFSSLDDFLRRVRPNVKERRLLAASGSLNDLPEVEHRRDALWQAEQLPLDDLFATPPPKEQVLKMMTPSERLNTDFALQGSTTGPHPMRLWRLEQDLELATSVSLFEMPHGKPLVIAGLVICRQRPGTAKGHCFISLEDEFGIANLFIPRKTFHQYKLIITSESFLLVRGRLQITEGRQPTVYVTALQALGVSGDLATVSHDFH
ncbi:MAG: error-prone DNA polymerase [Paracoccaceae bacterium]|jgi:error-prone DNA polymerase